MRAPTIKSYKLLSIWISAGCTLPLTWSEWMPQHSTISWANHKNEAYNSVHYAYEPTSWELWNQSRSDIWTFIPLAFFFFNSKLITLGFRIMSYNLGDHISQFTQDSSNCTGTLINSDCSHSQKCPSLIDKLQSYPHMS